MKDLRLSCHFRAISRQKSGLRSAFVSAPFPLELKNVTGFGEGWIMGPVLALLDIKNPTGVTQAANVH